MDRNAIILEDKRISVYNIPRDVLKGLPDTYKSKPRVYDKLDDDENDMRLNENLLRFVTDGIKFDKDVVKEKCAHALPYDPNEMTKIFKNKTELSNNVVIAQRTKSPKPLRKWPKETNRDDEELEMALNEIISQPSKPPKVILKPVFVSDESRNSSKDSLAIEYTKKKEVSKISSKKLEPFDENDNGDGNGENVFLTEPQLKYKEKSEIRVTQEPSVVVNKLDFEEEKTKTDWDDYILSKLSENTARWIVAKKTHSKQKEKLTKFIEGRYGKSDKKEEDLQLFEDSLSEASFDMNKKNKSKWKAETESLLSPANKIEVNKEEIPLYRLPQGIRRQIKMQEKNAGLKYNRTAQEIRIDYQRVLSAKTFVDSMKGRLETEKTIYITDNNYQLEMIGGQTDHLFSGDPKKIMLNNGKKFLKSTEIVYPPEFTMWINGESSKSIAEKTQKKQKKFTRGHKRWTGLPKEINENEMNQPNLDDIGQMYWSLLATTPDDGLRKLEDTNSTLAYIVKEWRSRWQIGSRWACADIEELINDMKDIHANVRFQAVVVCSRAAEFIDHEKKDNNKRSESDNDTTIYSEDESLPPAPDEEDESGSDENDEEDAHKQALKSTSSKNLKTLPEKLFVAVECLLNDTNPKVKLAAAITLFTVKRSKKSPRAKDKAEMILRETLNSHNNADKYAASQCLASSGICDFTVVQTLLQNYFNTNEQVTRDQMVKLLVNLSRKTYLINTMTGEYLNSDESRYKILACRLLPNLRRLLNRDLTQKLIHLMWNDNNLSVKKVAAQTLGRTGHGQQVHDELLTRIQSKKVQDRIEALKIVNYLGIMTVKLLPPYLKCFKDDYIRVRELACKSAQKLQITDESILLTLLELAQFDQIPKIKAYAMQSLGLISGPRNDVKECLLWSLRYDLEPLVRAEACHSLVLLYSNVDDNRDVVDALQERHLIEDQSLVKDELADALKLFGQDPSQDMPMVSQIKDEVRRLNHKNIIWSKITKLEKEIDFEFNKKRFIYPDEDDDKDTLKSERTTLTSKTKKTVESKSEKTNEKSEKTTKSDKSKSEKSTASTTTTTTTKSDKSKSQENLSSIKTNPRTDRTLLSTIPGSTAQSRGSTASKTDYSSMIETVAQENDENDATVDNKAARKPVKPIPKQIDSTNMKKSRVERADSLPSSESDEEKVETSNNKSFLSKLVDSDTEPDYDQSDYVDAKSPIQAYTATEAIQGDHNNKYHLNEPQQLTIDTIYEDSQEINM